ncbi:MAG: response regulator [Actinobacteria bacterium]|nr:response regulator [Actinomycetota bacterium]
MFLAGGGELGERIRRHDWASTSLGPVGEWPRALLTAVRIMLTSRQPIWIGWGEDLVYFYNDPYKSIIGGKHPEALGQPTRVVWREIWDVIRPMLETALAGEEGTYVESQLLIMERHGYREETYYTFSYSPVPSDDGSVGGIICANTDDTQRVIGERQLALLHEVSARTADARTWQEVCERAVSAFETNAHDLPFALIYVATEDGEIVCAGSSGTDGPLPALELPLAEALGSRDTLVHPVEGHDLPCGAWDEPPREVAIVPIPSTGQASPGGILVVGLSPFRRFDEGYRNFLSLAARQISASIAGATAYEEERRRAEELAALDRAKTTFFSNVSHELRTPLTLILGPVEEALLDPDLRTEQRERAEVVRRNALRLLRMVNTLLDFARVEASRMQARFRPVDLAALTRELVGAFAQVMDRAGLRLELDLERLPEDVYVDTDAWERIVLNLVSNAFKFTREGEIRVSLRAEDGEARLEVADTGTGIPADELPRLFERFHRVRNDAARTHEGTGIGLALVNELVSLHRGRVVAESEPGRGTTFTVAVPLGHDHLPEEQLDHERFSGTAAGMAVPYVEEASRWLTGIEEEAGGVLRDDTTAGDGEAERDAHIVVVDDNADMREYLVRLLEGSWRVSAYPDGAAALEAIRQDPPALVVSDVMMPRLDGFGLLRAMRTDSATSTVPLILVSARAGEEASVEGLEAGADDYLVKPFSARELLARVRMNLELARLRVEFGRLSALEEVRSRVITTVSHELRTPVSAIYGASKTLERAGLVDETTRRELLGVISGQSERLARITSDILTAETLASGVLTLGEDTLDAVAAAAEAVAAAGVTAPAKVSFRTAAPDAVVPVRGDRGRLQQVLANLLDNAVKYSPDGGEIELIVEPREEAVHFVVADHGIGVPAADREQIFRRFYRSDPELAGGVGGSGLGLYICRELTEAMGGRIWVEENHPRGARFVVALPAAAIQSEAKPHDSLS